MIKGHKYLNLDISVINVSALIIQKLRKDNFLQYDELLGFVVSVLGENAKEVFIYALNFLFLVDKIQYFDDIDAFQWKEATEKVSKNSLSESL
ncbi:MAG: ABC-three component system middle component 8 [Saprospiraceae bacterium]